MNLKPLAIFDLDGTLALIDHRRWILDDDNLTTDERWRKFFAACPDDKPNQPVIAIAKALHAAGYELWIFSGRSSEVQAQTVGWLTQHELAFFDRVIMRQAGDFTPDEKLKAQWLETMTSEDRERLVCIFDDRDKVCAMWRQNGITCCQVAPGNF